jgi:hypothetical protein
MVRKSLVVAKMKQLKPGMLKPENASKLSLGIPAGLWELI